MECARGSVALNAIIYKRQLHYDRADTSPNEGDPRVLTSYRSCQPRLHQRISTNLRAEHHLVSLKLDAGRATAQGRTGTCLHQSKDG